MNGDYNVGYTDWHTRLSYVKSGTRIVGCVFGMLGDLAIMAAILLLAEVVGVLEEWG